MNIKSFLKGYPVEVFIGESLIVMCEMSNRDDQCKVSFNAGTSNSPRFEGTMCENDFNDLVNQLESVAKDVHVIKTILTYEFNKLE